jgi:hypothetical protein
VAEQLVRSVDEMNDHVEATLIRPQHGFLREP